MYSFSWGIYRPTRWRLCVGIFRDRETCWREGFESLTALPGQSAMLQNLVCFSGPSQGFPPNCGGLHVRVRSLYPLPHVEEHRLHGDHSSQVPCTAIKAEVVSFLSKEGLEKSLSTRNTVSLQSEWEVCEKGLWEGQEQTNPKCERGMSRNFLPFGIDTKHLLLSRPLEINHNLPHFFRFLSQKKGHFVS